MTAELEPVAWRWAWKTTGSELEQRFADPDLYEWTYRDRPPSGGAAPKMDVEPLVTLSSAQEAIDKRDERIRELERERYELAYAITGGEDAPGLLDSVSVEQLVEIARGNHRSMSAEIDRSVAAEARASALQALLDEVVAVIEPFAGYVVPDPDPNSVSGERFGTKPDLKAFRAARSLAAKIKEAKG